jgi:diguanylate cyclase (GGDEF)-like protein/PAS domain S-box-containing protein
MENSLVGNYNILLVLLSFIVILLIAYTVFDIRTRIINGSKLKRIIWITIGALTMGIGIWTFHFIGILAFMIPVSINYSLVSLVISLAISVVSSFIALYSVSKRTINKIHSVFGWFVMGSNILAIHYIGMKAINMNASIINPYIFMLLVLWAFIPSFIFFKVTYYYKLIETIPPARTKLIGGFLMGLSITAMHYTIMFDVLFTQDFQVRDMYSQTVHSNNLATLIGIGSIFIIVIVLVSSSLDQKFTIQSTKLKINEQYYKSLFEENSEAVLLFDLDGRFLHFNQSENGLFGFSMEELINRTFEPFIVPEHLEKTIHHFNQALKGTTTIYETSVIHKNGNLIDLRVKNIPIVVDNEIVSVFGIIKDITTINQAEVALIEAESKYRTLVEQSLVGVYTFQDNRIVYANPRLVEIMGYSEDELCNLELSDFVYAEDFSLVNENIHNRLNKGMPDIKYEYRAIKKDGSLVSLEIHGSTAIYRGKKAIIGTVIDISGRKKAEETIQYMVYHEHTTGLPNSNFLYKKLSEFAQDPLKNKTSVLLIELERFKNINDTIGQETGNLLIMEASERVKTALSTNDILTRWHEDKFVILLPNTNHIMTSHTAQAILDALSKPIEMNHHYDLYVNPSIGISIYPDDSDCSETILNMANSALQYAKRHGNNSFHFYTPDLDEKSRENLELEMDLYKAIARQELTIHYQPQFNLSTGQLFGNEALIRWNHPNLGMVSPSTFIPIAEETGLIIPIGEWILKTACAQNKAWQISGYPPMVISVNLSSVQFSQSDLVEIVERVLAETKLNPQYLELEITESMTMDVNQAIETLQALKKLGIKISIDDFGTGFSSLYYLKEFPIDRLKIDQSFIRDCTDDSSNSTIVKTIISMAHHLHINVIAEGVETIEQLEFLQKNLCDEMQGYLLSKPLPAEELEKKFYELQQIIQTYGITIDVSQRLWLERELNLARQELQETIRQQDGMTFKYKYKDGKFIHTLCDGELVYRMGFTPDHVIGKELSEFLPLENAKQKEEYYRKAWQGEQNVSYEGEENGIYYFATLRPIIRKGKVVEVIASCLDITERKRIEKALRHSESNYRIIAENTTDIISIEDRSGVILYTSPSSEFVKGYSQNELIGSSGFSLVYPEDLASVESVFKEALLTKTSRLVQYRYIHRNNTLINLEAKVTPVIGENGEVEHFVLVARDITEQKKSEYLIRKQERLSVAGELAAGVAHEIRNPLTSIKGFIQLLGKGMIGADYYEIMLKEFNQVELIINEFLSLSKPQSLAVKPIDLNYLLLQVIALVEPQGTLKNIAIIKELNEDLSLINCDENEMKQVFINLLINAIESMSNGGNITVVTEKEDESRVVVRIIDQGCGMTEERVEKLGEPFYTNKEKGTGLGLMVSYKIIHKHQGEIYIESKINSGTMIEVKLPIKSPEILDSESK